VIDAHLPLISGKRVLLLLVVVLRLDFVASLGYGLDLNVALEKPTCFFCLGSYCPNTATGLPCPAGILLYDLVVVAFCMCSF
jgi:hypothetical protein